MSKSAQHNEKKKTFEERLERLEELGDEIRKNDIPLDDAIKAFEEGIKLAKTLEKDLEKIESRIEILMNGAEAGSEENPELGLFDDEE
ncbi:MAG: exodeoxyribonuclease VII small subunit [Treponema sp.]|jgi:exodeoxyribonuclease VII small subunit|nr:exodeoxyribonuclease VII small subunit [Treponema sp.]